MRRKNMKTIALCIDKENGRSFYGRRTSSDREVRKRLLDMCDTLHVDSYTAAQFTDRFLDFRFSGWRKVKKEDFEGYAHPKVTMNIWVRKKDSTRKTNER